MNYVIGIDPGASGAIAILDSDTGHLVDVIDMPTTELTIGGKTKHRVSPIFLQSELALYARTGVRWWRWSQRCLARA